MTTIGIPRLLEEIRAICPDISKFKDARSPDVVYAVAAWALVQAAELDERFSVGWIADPKFTGFRVVVKGDKPFNYDVGPCEQSHWFDAALEVVNERLPKTQDVDRRLLPYTRSLALATAALHSLLKPSEFTRVGSELSMTGAKGNVMAIPKTEQALKNKLRQELTPERVCLAVWGCMPGETKTMHTDALGDELDRMVLP
jgi:hypothetical protein